MLDSPKKRFLRTQSAKVVADFTADPATVAALDASILQMSWEAGAAKTPEAAAAMHWQLTGAYKLRDVFLTIALPEKQPVRPLEGWKSETSFRH